MSEWVDIQGIRTNAEDLPLRGQKVDFYDKMFNKIIKDIIVDFDPQDIDMDITKWRLACDCKERGCIAPTCKGQCGCQCCHEEYMDFLSCE